MFWLYRHDVRKANERGLSAGLRVNDTQPSERKPALCTRLVGPEPKRRLL
jgi:hypothetical protein